MYSSEKTLLPLSSYVPVTKARQRLLALFDGLNERRNIPRAAMHDTLNAPATHEDNTDLPIEINIRMTASLAPPCKGPLGGAQ